MSDSKKPMFDDLCGPEPTRDAGLGTFARLRDGETYTLKLVGLPPVRCAVNPYRPLIKPSFAEERALICDLRKNGDVISSGYPRYMANVIDKSDGSMKQWVFGSRIAQQLKYLYEDSKPKPLSKWERMLLKMLPFLSRWIKPSQMKPLEFTVEKETNEKGYPDYRIGEHC